jgi:2-polyprenyl-3-methyl-5-hydroxy-6-metoxy-1,4-benzoquinol methylase
MPFNLTFFERQIFLNHAWGPGPLLDMFGALAFKAVAAAVKLNIFETLEVLGSATTTDIAKEISADERGIGLLLDTLASTGYVCRAGKSHYKNSSMTTGWMLKKSPCNLSDMVGYFEDAVERWSYLDKSIRSGKPAEVCNAWLNRTEGAWERYHAGMNGVAMLMAGEIVKRCKLSSKARRMIDIGGSHGLYSVKFCQSYPGLSSVIFDWKQARSSAERTIAEHSMVDRVSFTEGDFLSDDLGKGYDVALLFNVIRIYPENEAMALLRKIRASLSANGVLFIADQFCTKTATNFNKANALLILMELYNGCKSHTYSAAEVQSFLLKSGFVKPKEILLRRSPGMSIVTAEKGG